MMEITIDNYKQFGRISDQELQNDINDIIKENARYEIQLSVLYENRIENKLQIYMLKGRISLNDGQMIELKKLQEFRNQQT